ncbi:AAA family ATPase [Streptomyces sp. NBC_00322]|uniref:ATP-binding protein n=1 Tax=Streptomyces sp. NBC_00322 TaxID=2975712 RepID=UPI002E2DCC93|nr:AAA family ATPase [Streptomyces sp. NBC_00322]
MMVGPDPSPRAAGGGGFAFVGRRRESGLLRGALRHPPAVVLIEGEAGVGKSRLVSEVTADLLGQGGRVLYGCCHPLREPFPYGPVIDALRQAGPYLPPAPEMSPLAGVLAPLLPELTDHLPPAPADVQETGAERYQLVRAVRAVLEACGTAVLVIEDLHWVDEATRELLLLLARDLPPHLGLVLTYRQEELPPRAPVLGAAYRRPPGTSGAEIHLAPLTESDIHDLTAAALGPRATHALGHILFERSAGLPLVVEEDLITLGEQGYRGHLSVEVVDPVTRLGQAVVPRGLREAVTTRVRGLAAPAVAVVEAAAVLAVPTAEPVLTQVAGLDAEQGMDALMEVLGAAVLRESLPMQYGFRHALAQQAAYQTIPGPQRRRLHEQAIAALRTLDSPPLVQIAHHFRALGDQEGWLTQAEAAAAQALGLGDQGTAAALLHAILAEPGLDEDVRTRVALALSRTATYSVEYTASVAVLQRILSDPQLPATTRGEIRVGLGLILTSQAGDPAGIRELENAIEELGEHRPETAAHAMSHIALFATFRGQPAADALAWIERAERTVQASPDEAARATVHADKVAVLAQIGHPEVWELVDRLPREGRDLAILRQTARALYNAADAALDLGYDDRVGALLEQSQDLALRTGVPHLDATCRILRQELSWYSGAWSYLEAAYASLFAQIPDIQMLEIEGSLVLGALAEARGQWSQALKRYTTAREASDYAVWGADAAAGIGRVRLAQGEPETAWAISAPATDSLRHNGPWLRASAVIPVAVEAALATGRPESATELTREFEQAIEGQDAPAAIAHLHLCLGLLLRDDDPARARDHFDRARATFRGIGRPYPAAQAAEHAARTLIPTTPHRAAQDLTEIDEIYRHLGATFDAARCQRTLRDLGEARPPVGRRGYGEQLSPREQEVAGLLATGATNRDIAHALFLSPRTAEHHVASVLKKLGVTSRHAVRDALTTNNP